MEESEGKARIAAWVNSIGYIYGRNHLYPDQRGDAGVCEDRSGEINNHKNMGYKQPTAREKALHGELIKRGIDATLQYNDGHKMVDIAILPARLFIEVDDLRHFTDPD